MSTMQVTITKSGRSDEYGKPLIVGATYTVDEALGISLVQAQFATDTNGRLEEPGNNPYDEQPAFAYGSVALQTGSSAASLNTTAIQNALNAAANQTGPGNVRISGVNGDVFYFTGPLIYGSNTTISVDPGVTLKQSAGNSKRLLDSQASVDFLAGGTTVTLAWSSGTLVTVTETAHGRAVGDYVWIWNITPSTYVGIQRIASVTDADTYVVHVPVRPASSPTGTAKVCSATTGTTITGGIWDYDWDNNSAANDYNSLGLCLHGTANCEIRDVEVNNCAKYCVTLEATLDCRVTKLRSQYNRSDGLKVYGPSFGTVIDGLSGRIGDDVVSVQAAESAPITYPYQLYSAGGDIRGVTAKNLDMTTYSGGSQFVLYTKSGLETVGVVAEGLDGYSQTGLVFRIDGDAGSKAKDVTIRRIRGQSGGTYQATFGTSEIDNLLIQDWIPNPKTLTDVPLIQLTATFAFGRMTFDGIVADVTGWIASGGTPIVTSGASGSQLIFKNCEIRSALSYTSGLLVTTGGTLDQIIVDGCDIPSSSSALYISTGTTISQIVLTKNNFDGVPAAVKSLVSTSISASGNRFHNLTQGVVRCEGTSTCTLRTDGTNVFSGTSVVFSIGSGTFTFNPQGFDLSVDPSAAGVNRGAGNYCKNSAAAAGTLVQNNLIVCDATGAANSWKQLSNPALAY